MNMSAPRKIVKDILGVQPGKQATIITDLAHAATIPKVLASCMWYVGAEVTVVTVLLREYGGSGSIFALVEKEEPPISQSFIGRV